MSKEFIWENRTRDLRKVKRYGDFRVMYYRTDLLIHSVRVQHLVEKSISFVRSFYPNFDAKKAVLMAKYHDDFELILEGGDVSLRRKLNKTLEEKLKLQEEEISAAKELSVLYPKEIEGYNYQELLLEMIYKNSVESQVVCFMDKTDGFCEAIHEILAGNLIFLEPVLNYPFKTFNDLQGHFPLIKKVFNDNKSIFNFSVVDLILFFKIRNVVELHNDKTILVKTSIYQYDIWREITRYQFSGSLLTHQIESYK